MHHRIPVLIRRIMLWAALAGLFASVYLLVVYTANLPIVCGGGHGCDAVRASAWAYVFGVIPRPLLGVAFYVGMLLLLVVRTAMPDWLTTWLYRLTVLGAIIGFVESAHLFWIQYAYIGAFCDWCLVSGAAATTLFLVVWGDRQSPLTLAQSVQELRWQSISFFVALIGGAAAMWWLL